VYSPRERRGPPAPVKVGDTYDVKIESKGRGGDGIARIQGFVVFVSGTNPGDQAKVRITAVRRRFATAEVVTG
jgi:predicted RNA-binding protein with TRAM domain